MIDGNPDRKEHPLVRDNVLNVYRPTELRRCRPGRCGCLRGRWAYRTTGVVRTGMWES